MLLKSAHFHNIGPFKDYKLEVGDLRGVVALVAPNGTGKTFTLEAGILGAAFLKMETQGTLVGRALDRDSWVESEIVYGQPFKVRQVVDAVSRKSETVLKGASEQSLLDGETGVTIYKAWAQRNLPDREVYLAGPFSAQKRKSFIEMGSAERIDVILKTIGVARLERGAAAARKRADKAEVEFNALVERIKDVRGEVVDEDTARASLDVAQELVASADARVASCREALAKAQREASDHAVRKTAREAADTLVATLREQLSGVTARRADAEKKLAGNKLFQAEADQIRAAAARLEAENAALTALELAIAEADKSIRAELDPWRDSAQRLKAAEQRAASARARLRDEAAILAAVAQKPELGAAVEAERVAVAALAEEHKALEAKRWAGASERLAATLVAHETVVELARQGQGGDPALALQTAGETSSAVLAADAAAVAASIETPKQLTEIDARLLREREHLATAEKKLAEAERLAARAPDLEVARADLKAAGDDAAEIRQGHALAVIGAFARALGRAETLAAARAAGAALEVTRKLAGRLEPLNDSDRRILELQGLIDAAQDEELRLAERIAGTELIHVGNPPDLEAAQNALTEAESAARERAADAVKAEQALVRAHEVATKVAELVAQRDVVAADLADWNRLALDLGRKGIQSAEVDSAGPELTELANSLLRRCHGPRYTVEIKTQRLDSKGKNLVDECLVTVIDSVSGTVKEAREHSGGECTILAEALSLALTMMGCRRAGLSDFTIVRDESGSALDPINNRAYVAMLRLALEVTGARHVLLVSHSEAVRKLCDHVIEIPTAA